MSDTNTNEQKTVGYNGLEHYDNKIKTYIQAEYVKSDDARLTDARIANGGNADTVNGHTVNADVPVDAKFTDTTYEAATQSANGLMSAADKKKLDSNACNIANKLISSSYRTLTIDTSDWADNSSGGYISNITFEPALPYHNFILM